jgi:hypothetical protein
MSQAKNPAGGPSTHELTRAGESVAEFQQAAEVATPAEVAQLGIRETTRGISGPAEHGQAGENGLLPETTNLVSMRERIVHESIQQPLLTLEEASKLGPIEWRLFRKGKLQEVNYRGRRVRCQLYTPALAPEAFGYRRLLITADVYEALAGK